jgi:ferredoxin/flavodoxin---NADP+ reductase
MVGSAVPGGSKAAPLSSMAMSRRNDNSTGVGEGRRVAIVGAGPAGFYATAQLLEQGFAVDLIDLLPTPFGLVRAGVAPDHPKIKSVTRMYEKTARKDGFRFFGGLELGADITRAELRERYHAVVYATGTADDNRLGIPGEDRPGSYPATTFVAWYNGHPHACDETFDLSAERAVVVGNGNVAIDVARMLVLDPDELAVTDTADHAIEAFNAAGVREVVLLGRRGPAQAAFTNPELRELGELKRADVVVDPADMELDADSLAWLEAEGDPTAKRNVELLREFAAREPKGHSHRVSLQFLRSPVEILGTGDDGPVTGVRVVRNRIERGDDGRLRAVATEQEEVIECGLVLRSIGYRGRPLDEIPFDERRGLIRNDGGRVCDDEGEPIPGEYCVGWIKRGPSGVIGTNKKDATDTVARIVEDAEADRIPEPADGWDADSTGAWLLGAAPGVVEWDGWQAIDEHERGLGEPTGRPRVKLVRMAELLDAGRGAATAR